MRQQRPADGGRIQPYRDGGVINVCSGVLPVEKSVLNNILG